MDVLNKIYAPIRWLLTKENKAKDMTSENINDVVADQIRADSSPSTTEITAQQLSRDDDISRFAANLKKILIASGYDVDIIFDDAVSIAKKI